MNRAVPEKLGVLQARNGAKDALLLRIAQSRLKADEVPHSAAPILHAELHDGMCLRAGARVPKSNRLHGPKAQRLTATPRHLLDRHASLEVRDGVEVMRGRLIGLDQRVDERVVLLARHRAVEIRPGPRLPFQPSVGSLGLVVGLHRLFSVARCAEADVLVDRVAGDDWRDGVVECERLHAKRGRDGAGERLGGERPRGNDADLR